MSEDIVEWVSDELHDLLGLSDRYTAEYLIGLAKKASSSTSFLKQLQDTGAITINNDVNSFATQLWDRVPHRTAVEKPARVKEREAILQRQKNKRYQLLMDSDEEDTIKKRRNSTSRNPQGVLVESSCLLCYLNSSVVFSSLVNLLICLKYIYYINYLCNLHPSIY